MLGKKRRKSTQTNLQQINKSTKNWSHMKKNPTTIFTQLLRTKAIKNKKKTNIVKKHERRRRRRKILP